VERWIAASGITAGPVFTRIWRAKVAGFVLPTGELAPPPLPRLDQDALTARALALIVQVRAVAAGFARLELGGHSLKRGALTTGMDRGVHPTKPKRLGRHKSHEALGEYLEFGDLFEGHPLGGFCRAAARLQSRNPGLIPAIKLDGQWTAWPPPSWPGH